MEALPLPLSWGKKNNEEGVWNLFSNSYIIWCSDCCGILHGRERSAGQCLSWVKSTLQSSPCQDLSAFSQALRQEHPHSGMAPKLSRTSTGCQGLSAHAGWSGIECWLRRMLKGSMNIPPERAELQGAPWASALSWFPSKPSTNRVRAKLWHLCTPVPQFSREKRLTVTLHPCRFVCSGFSPALCRSTSHGAAAFPTGNKLQGT